MAERTSDHFEMRRLESLSNTIFGVAMTLLAYDLPRAAQLADQPSWTEIYQLYATRLLALVLSFIIAGVFWFSHHRRLARQPEASRMVVFLNLIFLLSIILLPATNGLYGAYSDSSVVAVLYGFHLTIIAALNASLWLLVAREMRHFGDLAAAFFPLLVFVPGIALASVAPRQVQYFWLLAFGAIVVRRLFTHRVES